MDSNFDHMVEIDVHKTDKVLYARIAQWNAHVHKIKQRVNN